MKDIRWLMWIAALALLLIIFTIFFNRYALSTGELATPDFYARDIALAINSICSVDEEIIMNYTIDSKYDIEIKDGVVIVKKDFVEMKKYPYIQDSKCGLEISKEINSLVIKKV